MEQNENMVERAEGATSRTDLNHWLLIESDHTPDWERGRERLDVLTDKQLTEVAHAFISHRGGDRVPEDEAEGRAVRDNIQKFLGWLEKGIDPEDDYSVMYKAAPFTWELDEGEKGDDVCWHEALFMMASAGVLQVMGFEVEGTNIPVYPKDMPVDYWPEDGVVGLWSPRR